MKKVIGVKKFNGKVDITDPGYDHETWCRINDVEILPGAYECFIKVLNDQQTRGWGERVATIGIRHLGSKAGKLKPLGSIGVDAGLAGFFENKKDFTFDEWMEFCEKLGNHEQMAWMMYDGFFSSSGYGDGMYTVFAAKNDVGQIVSLEIRFIKS